MHRAHVSFPIMEITPAETPMDIKAFLVNRGWNSYNNNLWTSSGHTSGHYDLTWEQAVAVEFYRFITLGGK